MLLHPLTAVVLGAWMLRKRSVASRMRRQQESSLSIRARAVSAGLPIRADIASTSGSTADWSLPRHFDWPCIAWAGSDLLWHNAVIYTAFARARHRSQHNWRIQQLQAGNLKSRGAR